MDVRILYSEQLKILSGDYIWIFSQMLLNLVIHLIYTEKYLV